jgi:hypothetical protein
VSRGTVFAVMTRIEADAAGQPDRHDVAGGVHGPHMADRRGLTAAGAVALALALGVAGGFIDVMTGPGLRTVFALSFVAGCALAALKVHREDLLAAVIMPPLVYVVIALLAGAFSHSTGAGSMLTRQALELATSLVLGAPVLLTATGLAFVIAVARGIAGRRRVTQQGSVPQPQ